MKNSKMVNVINIAGGIVLFVLFALLFVLNDQKILIGVLFRGAFSLLILYNAIFVLFTKSSSFMVRREKNRKLFGVILLIVGIFGFVTTLLGYGITGYPLLNWDSLFN